MEKSKKGRHFIFDYIDSLYLKCQKVNLKCGTSYTDPPDWMKQKINNKSNQYDNCFQHTVTFALNHKEIGINLEGIKKITLYR